MAKFDELHPDASTESHSKSYDGYPPVVKLVCTEEKCPDTHTCYCGEKSFWVNLAAKRHVCSTECNQKLWEALISAFVVQQLIGNI